VSPEQRPGDDEGVEFRGRSGLLALVFLGLFAMVFILSLGREIRGPQPPVEATQHSGDCLAEVPPADVRPQRAWRSFWKALDVSDCRPRSWLTRYSEGGQTLEEFRAAEREPLQRGHPIEVFSLGHQGDAAASGDIPKIVEFLGVYFQGSVRSVSGRALPTSALRPSQDASGQYDAAALLRALEGTCPADASACLAVTDQDLSLDGLHYLFGLGQARDRLGVMSTFRLGEDVRARSTAIRRPARSVDRLRRALKLAVHEVGHQLGLAHCRHFRDCVMAGSSSLEASDRSHLMLCPLEHAKLQWQLGFASSERFAELADFAAKEGLHKEGAYWARMAEASPRYPQASGASAP